MKKKGISLIVLVITIVVIIILAAAVIFALGQNNPISSARVATVAGTKDNIESGILMYLASVKAKTLGNLSTEQILISDANYLIVGGNETSITQDEETITLYELSKELVKDKLKFDLKDVTSNSSWYINKNGKVYLIFSDENIPSYFKENGEILPTLSGFVAQAGTTVKTRFTITYNTDGAGSIPSQIKQKGTPITLATAPSKEGYNFGGWKKDNETTYEGGATYNIDEDLSLTAIWTVATRYSITYNSNGGSSIANVENIVPGTVVTLASAPTKTNATFAYFEDATGNHYNAGSSYTANADLALTAIWKYSASNIASMSTEAEKQNIIGKSVSLTSTNGWNNWKVFSSDGTNIMLITGDYVEINSTNFPNGYTFTKVSGSDYKVNSDSRANLLNALTNATTFNVFKDSAGKVSQARIPTIEDFALSYNAVSHDGTYEGTPHISKIYYKKNVSNEYNLAGDDKATSNESVLADSYNTKWLPKIENNYENLWIINNTTKTTGCWTVSPGYSDTIYVFNFNGYVGLYYYNVNYFGLRPVVILNSNINLVQNIDGTYTLE